MASGNGINIGAKGTPPIVTTQPELILRHSISDEELDMLTEANSDFVLEIFLVVIGAFFSSWPQAIPAMIAYFNSANDDASVLSLMDFVSIITFWACVLTALAIGIVLYKRTDRSKSLRDKIRKRTG